MATGTVLESLRTDNADGLLATGKRRGGWRNIFITLIDLPGKAFCVYASFPNLKRARLECLSGIK